MLYTELFAIPGLHQEHVGSFGIFSKVKVFLANAISKLHRQANVRGARKAGWKVRSGAASRAPRAAAPAVLRPRRHAKAIIGAIGSALYCARERPRDANKFGGGRGRTALPLVIIRLSRNCFYVLNGKVRYLLRTCRKTFLLHFSPYPHKSSLKIMRFRRERGC